MTSKPYVEIFTDGACSGNPGVGGYGAVLKFGLREKEISGYKEKTTNNRMELTAIIEALRHLKKPCRLRIFSDSTYAIKGITEWAPGWIKNDWRSSRKKPVLNRDLWEELLTLCHPHTIDWKWVKGHNGIKENERCDTLARHAIRTCSKVTS